MILKFIPNDVGTPPGRLGKLADADVHFSEGPLMGLKLAGFGIWQDSTGHRRVTLPSRTYWVRGEVWSVALLQPIEEDVTARERLTEYLLAAYAAFEARGRPADLVIEAP